MGQTTVMAASAQPDLLARNRAFYDTLWRGARLARPRRFNTWPLIQSLVRPAAECLEIGPGLRPRLPVPGTIFVDVSAPALTPLRAEGGIAVLANAVALPLPCAR